MAIELFQLNNGDIAIGYNHELHDEIKRVEYFRDQKLFMIVYNDPDHEGELLHYEISEEAADLVRHSANDIIMINACNPSNQVEYKVPLIQIGV